MLQIFKLLFICLGLALGSSASAQVTEASLSADGSGMSRDEAVANALANAAGQAFGIQLDVSQVTNITTVETISNDNDEMLLVAAANKNIAQITNSPGNSPILGYTLDYIQKGTDNTWDAAITLRYAKYEKVGADSSRRSVVVTTSEKRHRAVLLNTVSQSLVASRRFDVLTRNNSELFDQEADFITSADAGNAEVARLSLGSGADYLVIAELQGLGISNNMRETIRMTGEVLVKSAVSGTLKLQVVEFSTRKVKWSGAQKFGATYEGASSVSANALAGLISGAANKLTDQLVPGIYPIQVVKVMGEMAIINRGEGSVNKGDSFAVYLTGEELIDPQSGESLGALETEVGFGKITDVKPKFAYLKMDGVSLDEESEYIVRKGSPKPAKAAPTRPRKNTPKAPAAPSRKDTFLN